MKSTTGAGTATAKPAEDMGGGKKLLIRQLIIKDGKVNLTMPALAGKSVSADLPEIELRDLGSGKGGAPPGGGLP